MSHAITSHATHKLAKPEYEPTKASTVITPIHLPLAVVVHLEAEDIPVIISVVVSSPGIQS